MIVDIPDGRKGAYETVLVILASNSQDLNPTQVIKQVVKVQVDVKGKVFKDKDNNRPEA